MNTHPSQEGGTKKSPSDSSAKRREYMARYLEANPWAKKYKSSKIGAIKYKRVHTMTTADFKELWFRDKAWELKIPSIDRIDNTKGYIKENCRYIELRENEARNNRGRINTKKQTEAGANNLRRWNAIRRQRRDERLGLTPTTNHTGETLTLKEAHDKALKQMEEHNEEWEVYLKTNP